LFAAIPSQPIKLELFKHSEKAKSPYFDFKKPGILRFELFWVMS